MRFSGEWSWDFAQATMCATSMVVARHVGIAHRWPASIRTCLLTCAGTCSLAMPQPYCIVPRRSMRASTGLNAQAGVALFRGYATAPARERLSFPHHVARTRGGHLRQEGTGGRRWKRHPSWNHQRAWQVFARANTVTCVVNRTTGGGGGGRSGGRAMDVPSSDIGPRSRSLRTNAGGEQAVELCCKKLTRIRPMLAIGRR